VALVGFFLIQQQQRGLAEEMTKRGLTMAENLAAGAKTSLLTNDHLNLNVLVKDAIRDPDVAYVAIANQEGEILAHSDVALIGRPVERPAGLAPAGSQLTTNTYTAPNGGRIFDFAVPLSFSQTPLGALYLGFSDRAIAANLRHARNQAVIVTVIMVLLGVGGAVGLATASRPISRLVAGTKTIARNSASPARHLPGRAGRSHDLLQRHGLLLRRRRRSSAPSPATWRARSWTRS
jgi:serine/threonine-protein kinase